MYKKYFKDDLIILKRFTINENDILVNAFGRFSGKIQLKAKGGKNILSKFTGRLEPLSIIQAEIYNSGKSLTLTNAHLKYNILDTPNFQTFELSQKICLLLNKTLPYNEASPDLFRLIENITESIQNKLPHFKTEIFFLTKFLDITGLLPNFLYCHKCQCKFTQSPYLQDGQLNCPNCTQQNPEIEHFQLDINTLKLLNYISLSNQISQLQPIKIPTNNSLQANKILEELIGFLHT
jgi:DNA repair protein RecO